MLSKGKVARGVQRAFDAWQLREERRHCET